MRDFWLDEADEDGEKHYTVWTHKEPTGIHVRTVDPEYDAMVLELVEALKRIIIDDDGIEWPHPTKAQNTASEALAKYEAWKKK